MAFACPTCRKEDVSLVDGAECGMCCGVCRELDALMLANADKPTFGKCNAMFMKHCKQYHWPPSSSHPGNGAHMGPFAFTLTMSPNDNLTVDDMIAAARKLMSQKSCPVAVYAWFLEYGDEEAMTHPHIHGMYETVSKGRIEAKHFKRAWPIWDEKVRMGFGFRGGYHKPVRDGVLYSNYISKQGRISEAYPPLI